MKATRHSVIKKHGNYAKKNESSNLRHCDGSNSSYFGGSLPFAKLFLKSSIVPNGNSMPSEGTILVDNDPRMAAT